MEDKVIVSFSFVSKTGKSIYNMDELRLISTENVLSFMPKEDNIKAVAHILEKDFDVVARTEVGLSISGEISKVETYFKTKIKRQRIKYIKNYEFYEYISKDEIETPSVLKKYVEKVFIQKQFFVLDNNEEVRRPSLDYYHLNVPDDIQKLGQTAEFYNHGCYGDNIRVTLIDTGFYYKHPYFKSMNYDYQVISVFDWFDSSKDERGHGSGMSSILLSVAPKVKFTMIKACDEYVSYPLTAFQKAVMIESEVINCSWGTIGFEPQLHLEVVNAIRKGCVVVFASGNGSTDRRASILQTIAHPEVISAGGCYIKPDGNVIVSNLSSSYDSDIYENRFSPDLCGICGLKPYGQLILFPSQPASVFDRKNGERDGTQKDDGWFVSSGTSAAAAYVSGMIALAFSFQKNIPDMKQVLIHGCTKVSEGSSFMRHIADGAYWNKAVGYGFLNGKMLFEYLKEVSQ